MALFTAIGTALGATAAVAATATTAAVAGTAFATGLGATVFAGTAAYMMMNQGGNKPAQQQASQMPTAPKAPKMADASKIAQQQATDKKRAAARSKSVKTNPLGIKDEADVVRKTLLGK